MRYNHFSMLPEGAFEHIGDRKIKPQGGGGIPIISPIVNAAGNIVSSAGQGISDIASGNIGTGLGEIAPAAALTAAAVAAPEALAAMGTTDAVAAPVATDIANASEFAASGGWAGGGATATMGGVAGTAGDTLAGITGAAAPVAAGAAGTAAAAGAAGATAVPAAASAAAPLTASQILQNTAAGIGVLGGVNALTGNKLFGGLTGSGTGTAADPYGPYRAQAAQELQSLLQDPSQAYAQPGYQQQLTQGMKTAMRGAAATGQSMSGAELAALQNVGQNTFGSYYNTLLGNLMQLSGASTSPVSGFQAQQQAQQNALQTSMYGAGMLSSAAGSLANIYNTPAPSAYANVTPAVSNLQYIGGQANPSFVGPPSYLAG